MMKYITNTVTSDELVKSFIIDVDHTFIFFDQGDLANLTNYTFEVKNNATLNIYNVVTSSHTSQLTQKVNLTTEGANVSIVNVILAYDDAKITSNVMINHLVKNTNSSFSCYVIAKDHALIVLDNNAKINQHASKSICHQKAKGLTLSKEAKIKAMPNLFIDEYDVIASHSASVGSISKEDLFYLMSRGLSYNEASKVIVLGFIKPVVDKLEDETLKEQIYQSFINKL